MGDDDKRFDPQDFRRVLGHYPTGVALITALGVEDEPLGMIVGSFASVSLDPPLVTFLPERRSRIFSKISTAESFVVNVLSNKQEDICRTFASRFIEDKWAGVTWRPSPSGAPILDGAVAWIDCTFEATYDGGDHHIVIGRVNDLDVQNPTLPLLFFQGGYGRFSPMSLVALSEADLLPQLQLAEAARVEMEQLASATGLECTAQARVDDQLVLVASVGTPGGHAVPRGVGLRTPFMPPFGTVFVAWSDDDTFESWIRKLGGPLSDEERAQLRRRIDRVRERGWSMGLRAPNQNEVDIAIREFSKGDYTPAVERNMRELVQGMADYYEPEEITDSGSYAVNFIRVPVFGPDGEVVLALHVAGTGDVASGEQINNWREQTLRAGERITAAIRGGAKH